MPHPLIDTLPCPKEHGRIKVTAELAVPDWPGVWALGDCALVPDLVTVQCAHQPLNMRYGKARSLLATCLPTPTSVGIENSTSGRLDNLPRSGIVLAWLICLA